MHGEKLVLKIFYHGAAHASSGTGITAADEKTFFFCRSMVYLDCGSRNLGIPPDRELIQPGGTTTVSYTHLTLPTIYSV